MRGKIDNTLYVYKTKTDVILVQIYVDDIIFRSTSTKLCKQFAKLMTHKYEISMMGVLTYFLRLQIKQSERGISINQENYIKDMLKKYDINGLSVKTLMVSPNNLGPDPNRKAVNETQYNVPKRKSTSNACQLLGGKLMKSQLSDYDIVYEKVPIFCDKTSAIAISNNPVMYSRTKHIDMRYHFIRYHIIKGDIEFHFIPTQYQLPDIFTNPLDELTFKKLIVELAFGRNLEEIHVTWLNLGRNGTRLQLYTKMMMNWHTVRGDGVTNSFDGVKMIKRRRQSIL
ncbi:retrovirus-related pol polyprotein from transposon TNT 1-94 [Tanacetum coccineum]